ncbi:MAG: TlpA family protein disulfide reductase [Rhizobiales bacterium]|nr:TlpA family protein disulfide reductase [Hyphomicrobiales bacterium]
MPQKTLTKIIISISFIFSALLGGYLIYFSVLEPELNPNSKISLVPNKTIVESPASVPQQNNRQATAKGEVAAFLFHPTPVEMPVLNFIGPKQNKMTLADFKGKTILLNLWATWCAPCRYEMPTLDNLQAKLGSDKFEVVTLNVDRKSTKGAEAFFSEIGIKNLKLYADPTTKAMRILRARGLPMTLLINADGKEVGRLFGPAEWNSQDAINLIQTELK